jgi:transcriptional regulator with XRE-family HTH domain
MSGVRDVLAARQGAAFGEALRGLIESHGFTTSAFCRKVYGQSREGKPKGSGQLYPALNGSGAVTERSLIRWAAALNVPVGKLMALRDRPSDPTGAPTGKGAVSPAVTPAAKPREPAIVTPAAKPSGQEQFSLVIDQGGTATLRLNLVGVPMGTAMRAMSALTGAGLIKAPEEG